ncbi:hypothetical protein PPSIR1_18332 [Plesiocystis pacifica SIR-1]|uniref:Uncharacterized protein n=1 Tax=Plesiocystis pacifica SIR-1 TaxID=391625 RepID=A6GBY1_9BACT|nr:hypothetical protein [Plesiocystis pacifica]EDM76654.1 hypothetical protein PPSIR1_18332 [Plesiocystis pacifica SIR-1]
MGELVSGLIDLIRAGGKAGAVSACVLGLLLIPLGYFLFAYAAGPGAVWPIMLGVSILGLGCLGLGLGALFGNQARLDAAMDGGGTIARANFAEARLRAETAKVPFGACGDCGHVVEGGPAYDRCPNCFSVPGWVIVENEDERGRAISSLS